MYDSEEDRYPSQHVGANATPSYKRASRSKAETNPASPIATSHNH